MPQRIAAAGLAGERVRMTANRIDSGNLASGERVGPLLEEQLELSLRLDELSLAQAALIDEGDYQGLLDVLADREGVIASLVELQAELAIRCERWEEFLAAQAPEVRAQLTRRMDELSMVTARIAGRDEADRAKLERSRNEAAQRLGGISKSRGALAAYIRRGDDVPTFQDREA